MSKRIPITFYQSLRNMWTKASSVGNSSSADNINRFEPTEAEIQIARRDRTRTFHLRSRYLRFFRSTISFSIQSRRKEHSSFVHRDVADNSIRGKIAMTWYVYIEKNWRQVWKVATTLKKQAKKRFDSRDRICFFENIYPTDRDGDFQ